MDRTCNKQNKYDKYFSRLNSDDVNIRLESLKRLVQMVNDGQLERPVSGGHVNNHIHTTYSFSPYSPAKALWMAYNSGLNTAGIMDHDSIAGAREFIEAGKIIGMATTIGVECRVDFSGTPLNGRKLNNPDQKSIAYVTLHGIPHTMIDKVAKFFEPYIAERNVRNCKMVDRINGLLEAYGIQLDFELDVLPLSENSEGGTVTERHICFALAGKLMDKYGKGEGLVTFLRDTMKLNVNAKLEKYLLDENNPYYDYDLLGLLKSDMIGSFYIDATAECPDVREFIKLAEKVGAISAYAYLGDVGDSVTGDKKAQKFEDEYLDELMKVIKELGFNAVTYMPSRNTLQQLDRLKGLCDQYGFFQISGEDINSPRQSFVCDAMTRPEFSNLIDSTWALIGHEKAATENLANAMFSHQSKVRNTDLADRIRIYKKMGMAR